ncbi:MAG: diguanylate cyclase [Oscillospiraceae bacterium]|nr:diguanylate cyclase [Oscillospiraceae bacterium]
MRNFEILRYLNKWRHFIFIVSVLGALLVYKYAMYNQEYTAQTIISYTNTGADEGKTPSGDDLDVTEVYSSTVITNVLEDIAANIRANTIRTKCKDEGKTPNDEETKKEGLLEKGEEYEFFPTDYVVSYSVSSDYTKDFARSVLDSIIKNYFIIYGEKYINQQTLPNNKVSASDSQYDYIERAEILETWVTNISDYLAAKKETNPDYRSAETGYSFTDLYEIYKSIEEYDIPQIYSLILEQTVSVDRETLIKKYQSDIGTYQLDLENLNSKIENLQALIDEYSQKNKEGVEYHYGTQSEDGSEASDYILKNVYEEWDDVQINTETTYDTLINEFIGLESEKEKLEVDIEHKENLLDIFTTAEEAGDSDMSNKGAIEYSINELSERLDSMYEIVSDTVDEYNQFVGAYNVSTLSSIYTSEKINVQIYIVLALLVFFLGGCISAIILGRSKDFLEYLMYTDRKTGVPNRARCDIVIDEYNQSKLKDHFCFLIIRIDNLKNVNTLGGRAAGDELLKAFGKILRRAASSYGFVGYNGSDQFFGMFEDCTLQRAKDFAEYLKEFVDYHNTQNPQERLEVSVAISETSTENVYNIRALMGLTFRKPME